MDTPIPVFDGHNDVALRLLMTRQNDPVASFLNGGAPGHIDLPKARAGNLVGGLFAIFSPSTGKFEPPSMSGKTYDTPLPAFMDVNDARTSAITQISLLLRVERESEGQVVFCRTTTEINAAIARGALAVVLHMEGADAIDEDLHFLDNLYAMGLRSLGPVWSRPNVFGHGVPFRFPGSPDTGPGLTPAGRNLVAACNRLGIMIDLSHMTEKGFWDVAELSNAPLVATHSNAHAVTPSPRNLTDEQLAAIRDTKGVVGLNFATGFLRDDGQMRGDTDVEWMVRHLDALIERVGETCVALGSDFDGATVPNAIGSAAGLPVLFDALRRHGYDEPLLRRIASENWLSLLARTIDR
jgi:membrane dipeptidase